MSDFGEVNNFAVCIVRIVAIALLSIAFVRRLHVLSMVDRYIKAISFVTKYKRSTYSSRHTHNAPTCITHTNIHGGCFVGCCGRLMIFRLFVTSLFIASSFPILLIEYVKKRLFASSLFHCAIMMFNDASPRKKRKTKTRVGLTKIAAR